MTFIALWLKILTNNKLKLKVLIRSLLDPESRVFSVSNMQLQQFLLFKIE